MPGIGIPNVEVRVAAAADVLKSVLGVVWKTELWSSACLVGNAFARNAITGVKSVLAVVEWFCAGIAIHRLRKIHVDGGYVVNVMIHMYRGGVVSRKCVSEITSWKLRR